MGIDRAALKEGVCQSRGHTVKVVDRGSELRLNELDATFHGYATAKSLTAETGTASARGTFVILDLAVTNRLNRPVRFDPDQIVLRLGGRTFTHHFDAMNMPGPSFVWNSAPSSPAGRGGDRDLRRPRLRPRAAWGSAARSSSRSSPTPTPPAPRAAQHTLGVFRTYH